MKQQGSAIVIAVFLVAAIGGLAFSFGRLFMIESRNANIAENGISAYYAAESGIEEGFLRYRYDRNAEIPFGNPTNSVYWTVGDNKVFRSYPNATPLPFTTRGTTDNDGIAKTSAISATYTNQQVYDLRMGFAGTLGKFFYGQDVDDDGDLDDNDILDAEYGTGNYEFLKIPKDETYKIDLSKLDFNNLAENDIKLMAKYLKPTLFNPDFDQNRAIIYAKLTVDYLGNGTDIREYKTIITSDGDGTDTCNIIGRAADLINCKNELAIATASSTSPNDIVWSRDKLIEEFQSKFGAKPIIAAGKKVTLSLKPLFYDAYIGVSTMGCGCANPTKASVVPGPVTSISSTGYFGGATRTISANIDRQSGTLYDLFDYVIYQKP